MARSSINNMTAPSVFDALAADYDRAFTRQVPAVCLRNDIQKRVGALLNGPSRILEVGCGTGEDAAWLANQGHTVIATDASENMLRAARDKISSRELADKVSFHQLDLQSPKPLPELVNQPVDLVLGNFGVINCVSDLTETFRILPQLVCDGGFVVFTVMGRFCAWETLYFMSRGRFRDASRRWSGRSLYSTRSGTTVIRYYSPRRLRRAALPHFRLHGLHAVGTAIPPSYLFDWCQRRPRVFTKLKGVDRAIANSRLAPLVSDHYQITFVKRDLRQPDAVVKENPQ